MSRRSSTSSGFETPSKTILSGIIWFLFAAVLVYVTFGGSNPLDRTGIETVSGVVVDDGRHQSSKGDTLCQPTVRFDYGGESHDITVAGASSNCRAVGSSVKVDVPRGDALEATIRPNLAATLGLAALPLIGLVMIAWGVVGWVRQRREHSPARARPEKGRYARGATIAGTGETAGAGAGAGAGSAAVVGIHSLADTDSWADAAAPAPTGDAKPSRAASVDARAPKRTNPAWALCYLSLCIVAHFALVASLKSVLAGRSASLFVVALLLFTYFVLVVCLGGFVIGAVVLEVLIRRHNDEVGRPEPITPGIRAFSSPQWAGNTATMPHLIEAFLVGLGAAAVAFLAQESAVTSYRIYLGFGIGPYRPVVDVNEPITLTATESWVAAGLILAGVVALFRFARFAVVSWVGYYRSRTAHEFSPQILGSERSA